MGNFSNYKIFPNESTFNASKGLFKENSGRTLGIGCLSVLIIITLIYSSARNQPTAVTTGLVLIIFVGIPAVIWGIITDLKKENEEYKNAKMQFIDQKEKEAMQLTDDLQNIFSESLKLAAELPIFLQNADNCIKKCRVEFQQSAFDPYWTLVENATYSFEEFRKSTKTINHFLNEYYRKLKGQKHSFPIFPIDINSIPVPTKLLDEFQQVVRLGQTNFQFASIWEQRKIRQVLIAGFQTLGEAVDNMASVVHNEIILLRNSLNSSVSLLIEEEIITRDSIRTSLEKQNEMLDNVQRRHKPLL